MGILDQIAQPQMADIAGALDIRQKRLDADENKRKEIRMGQLIAEATPNLKKDSPLYNMALNDPKNYMLFTKAIGVPLNSGDQMQQYANDVNDLYNHAQSDPKDAYNHALELKKTRNAQGVDTPQLDKWIGGMEEDPQKAMTSLFVIHRSINESQMTESEKLAREKFEYSKTQGAGGSQFKGDVVHGVGGDFVYDGTSNIAKPLLDQYGNQIKSAVYDPSNHAAIAGATTTATEQSQRRDLFKTQGLAAAENIPVINRALELQKEISTGGGSNTIRKLQDYLGVTSSDAGELNSIFAQNLLGQLKSTFGGNPTEGERDALAQATASYKQSGKINEKLLEHSLTLAKLKVERGRRAAEADKDSSTLKEYDAFNDLSYSDKPATKPAANSITLPSTTPAPAETAAQRFARLTGGK